MSDADNFAAMDMAHEFCDADEHCDKWHCPYTVAVYINDKGETVFA